MAFHPRQRILCIAALLFLQGPWWGVFAQAAEPSAEDAAFFRTQVHPVLKAHCVKCHGGEKVKGGLVLTNRAGLVKGGESGPGFDAGAPTNSRLVEMMSYKDSDHEMPPAGRRPASEVAVLTKWLEMGAPYDPALESEAVGRVAHVAAADPKASWWAYEPVRTAVLLAPAQSGAGANPVDVLLRKSLDAAGLKPNGRASREVLVRRAYYDLIGLPPSPEEVRRFVEDRAPDAWSRLVDSLLARPEYGEKWARHWMDVVRYAETEGFERDSPKPHIWRYRDYLIDAFNADLPYDRFLTEQLAGDELAEPTQQSLAATGFLRLMQFDDEPADRLLAKYDILADIVQVTSEAFLGTTMGCARCHDHKKDPITQRDYYSFMSFFHGLKDYGGTRNAPLFWLDRGEGERLEREQFEKLTKLGAEEARLEEILRNWHGKVVAGGAPRPEAVVLVDAKAGTEKAWIHTSTDPGPPWRALNLSPKGWETSETVAARKGEPVWMRSKFGLEEIPKDSALELECAGGTEVVLNGHVVLQAKNLPPGRHTLDLGAEKKRLFNTGSNTLAVRTCVQADGRLPEVRLVSGKSLIEHADALLKGPRKADREELGKLAGGNLLEMLKGTHRTWLEVLQKPLGIPISAAADVAKPEPLSVHRRGNPQNLGDPVVPAFPAVMVSAPNPVEADLAVTAAGSSGRRLALARWLTRPENPLVSRVAVNRVWQHHFGRGLVATPNDFGRLGELPSHPELLDWLARSFVEKGWSVKALHRLLMTSEAYQQSSAASAEAAVKDPENRLLWRYPMRRLTAEELRDSILSMSGVLRIEQHGPPVYPPLPREVLETQSRPGADWPLRGLKESARRSVYVHVKRSLSVPMLADHDQAPTDTSCAARFVSTVPTQALSMLNSEFMEEQSTLFAERLEKEAGAGFAEQIQLGLRLVLQRAPTAAEVEVCKKAVHAFESEFGLSEKLALRRFALMALNLNEFLYLD